MKNDKIWLIDFLIHQNGFIHPLVNDFFQSFFFINEFLWKHQSRFWAFHHIHVNPLYIPDLPRNDSSLDKHCFNNMFAFFWSGFEPGPHIGSTRDGCLKGLSLWLHKPLALSMLLPYCFFILYLH